jgi:ATP-dependent RNA circularization protein (DNA/RNA ligase family)
MVSVMLGQQFVATEKADGTSTTVYKHDGHFGVCTRNWEIRKVGESGMQRNAMWQLAERYDLESKLPEGIAIQWETVGPKIQKNPLGLKRMEPYVFDVWFIGPRRYGSWTEMVAVAETLGLPTVRLVEHGAIFDFDSESLRLYAEGTYPSGKQREGVVIRPVEPQFVNGERLSFKVVNLKYKE